MKSSLFFVAAALLLATAAQASTTNRVTVTAPSGPVIGETVVASYRTIARFLGVPYAQPPKRFRRPVPVEKWSQPIEAVKWPANCYQNLEHPFNDITKSLILSETISEDCLNLNVWTPYPRPKNAAVMVWIFGGGFYSGTPALSLYDGRTIVAEENIVLVCINYRLGNLGFLFFEKARTEAPGNAAMFDQIMALQWVRDNIKFFGGNPNNVTLFGESAGAVSISFHLLSPLSRNLFSQAILQSGGPTVPWGTTPLSKMNQRGLLLAEAVGCPRDEDKLELTMECLRNVHPLSLVGNETNENYGVVEFVFTPIVDGVFLDDQPEKLLESKDFKKTKLLLGSNTEEGTYFIIYHLTELFKNSDDVFLTREDFVKTVKELTPNMNRIGQEAIMYQYTDWHNPDDTIKNRDAIDKIVGDYHFTCHVNRIADKYASVGNEVYMYYFTHRSTQNPWPKWMGTMHGDEINFIFGEPLNPKLGYTSEEMHLSRQMMKCWANFAKSGNPTLDENRSWSQLHWPLYTTHSKEYLTLATNSTAIGRGPRTKQCAFWQNYLPKLIKDVAKIEEKSALCRNVASMASKSSRYLLALALVAVFLL
nr:acetylcholinesterase 1 [Aleuroglyphus ovatus]